MIYQFVRCKSKIYSIPSTIFPIKLDKFFFYKLSNLNIYFFFEIKDRNFINMKPKKEKTYTKNKKPKRPEESPPRIKRKKKNNIVIDNKTQLHAQPMVDSEST